MIILKIRQTVFFRKPEILPDSSDGKEADHMKRVHFKRKLAALAAFAMAVLFLPLTSHAAEKNVEVNAENFPDENFRSYVLTLPGAEDGTLTPDEIKEITYVDCSRSEISSLAGIEYFKQLPETGLQPESACQP